MKILLLAMALVLIGCHRPSLICRSEYLYPLYLASVQANTPDPCSDKFCGMQIISKWYLPYLDSKKPAQLQLIVRYGNRDIEKFYATVQQPVGWCTFRLMNPIYWEKGGVVSYKASIFQEGIPIADWCHFLWADLIEIK
jgi:hypothetical protein